VSWSAEIDPALLVTGGIVMLVAGAVIVGAAQDAIDQFFALYAHSDLVTIAFAAAAGFTAWGIYAPFLYVGADVAAASAAGAMVAALGRRSREGGLMGRPSE
jgi:hypothetical protein